MTDAEIRAAFAGLTAELADVKRDLAALQATDRARQTRLDQAADVLADAYRRTAVIRPQ